MKLGLLSLFVSTAAWAWPDLQVVKTGPALAAPGDVLTYTLAYSNNGGQKSTSVVLKDYLPNYVTVLTNTLVNGSVSGSTVTWSIGTLYSGSQGSRSFQVRVTTNAFFGLSLTNRAQITGKEAEETGKTNNNTSILVTLITNRPPVAQDDFYILTEKTTLTVPAPGILGNDSDPEASALTTVLVNPPAHGTLTLNPNGGFIYQPADDFVGLDNFTYRANDGYANSGVATVTLSVQPCYPAVDVMLVIDRSSSMKGQPYDDARRACSNFVQNLKFAPTADQAGLASYNSSATLDQKLTNNLQLLKQSINSIPAANGYTSITLGLQTAQNELLSARHNPEALPVILLLSDGLPTGTDSPSNALFAAAQAKGAGTRIFTVGLGGVDHALMSGIASYPGDYFYTTNSSDLTDLFNAISTIICRPPTNIFTIGPSNLIVCPGDHATFTVAASGCDAFTYQWTKGGSPLAGQTNNSLLIPNVSATNAGVYGVEVRSNCKSVTNSATLTVRSNVTAMGPFSQTNCTGGSATFTTTAGGTGPYTYQWLRNGSVIPGQTGATLMLNSISTNDSANYGVVVSGVCGAPVTNSASLTVNPPPAISAPGDRTVNSGTPWTFGTPTANYPIVVVSTTTNNLCGDALIAQRTWQTTDPCGNVAQATQTVTVLDRTPPVITCPANLVLPANDGVCSRSNVTFTVTATDNCGVTNLTTVPPSGSTFPVGVTTVTSTATDASGNQSTCIFTVTINDAQNPTISCPPLVTVIANNGSCAATNVTLGTPAVNDNCGVASITNNAPAIFPVGTNFITWTAKDNAGNSASCVQTVIVTDNQIPTISCPLLVTVVANNGSCAATNVILGTPTVNDNCGVASITNNAPAIFPVGTNFVTWTVKDNAGNSASCVQTVIVTDNQLPTISCPPLVTVIANNGACSATNVVFGTPTVSDNCGIASITNNAPAMFPVGTNFVTWTVKDNSGNSASCVQTVIIRDNQLPTITCPPLVTVIANNGACTATNLMLGTPTVSDNCGVASITNNAPAIFPVGTNFVTWTVKDNSGNSASCVQTVIVRDNQLPTITCPTLVTVIANNGSCAATNVILGTPTVNDNCGVASVTNNAPAIFPVGTNFVTWTVKDNAGNSASCVQTVVITDGQPPQISCPQIQNRIVEAGMPWAFDTVTVTDNCGTPALSVTTVTNLGCGHTFTAVRTWRATDSSGNAAECTQTVSVLDTTAPVVSITSPTNGAMFIAPADFTVLADAQDTNGGIARVEFFASTNRFGEATNGAPYFAVTSGVPAGTYVLTARATDACGNMRTSAPVSINVIDRPPLTVVRSMRLNPATSLYEIRVRVTNPTYSFFDAVRVLVEGLPPTIQVYNPSGTTNGVPYVETQFAVTPDGTSVEFVIEFYTTSGVVPNPTFRPQLISANRPGGTAALFGTAQPLHRALMLPNRTFLIEFPSLSNRVYYVQYSTNLTDWKTAQPAIAGSGNWYQWLDGGLPKTDSPPATTPKRFYRLILLP